ncbi:MAG: right-handed parallel beta-helix repeat-containing protein [Phycisphaerales bacterium]
MHTKPSRIARFAPVATAALIAFAGLVVAGPLNPPVGAVTSTGKTLTEVEPRIAINLVNTPGDGDSLFKITQPGSYYLTGNVTGVNAKDGIEIAASGVTIDLNGFDMLGVTGSRDAVWASLGSLTNITVRNGSIRNWGGIGINFQTNVVDGGRVDGVDVRACFKGMITGRNFVVSNCTALANTNTGFDSQSGSIVTDCTAYGNGAIGFDLSTNNTVSGCSSAFNSADGFSLSSGNVISHCTSSFNSINGFAIAGDGNLITGNTADSNGNSGNGAGIVVSGTDNRVEGNTMRSADAGLRVTAAGNFIVRNTAASNTTGWEIVPGNSFGPIVIASTNAAIVIGNSAPGTLGSTDPNANFTY